MSKSHEGDVSVLKTFSCACGNIGAPFQLYSFSKHVYDFIWPI
jgi:hypothetical protein